MRFYGLSVSEIERLSARRVNSLWQAIDVLEAQEHITHVNALEYPNLKPSAKRERNKKLYSVAYPRDIYKRDAKDVSVLLQKIGGSDGRRK